MLDSRALHVPRHLLMHLSSSQTQHRQIISLLSLPFYVHQRMMILLRGWTIWMYMSKSKLWSTRPVYWLVVEGQRPNGSTRSVAGIVQARGHFQFSQMILVSNCKYNEICESVCILYILSLENPNSGQLQCDIWSTKAIVSVTYIAHVFFMKKTMIIVLSFWN